MDADLPALLLLPPVFYSGSRAINSNQSTAPVVLSQVVGVSDGLSRGGRIMAQTP